MDARIVDYIREEIKELKVEIKSIDGKVDKLLEFKWRIVGGSIVVSLIITALFQIGLAFLQRS